MNPIDEHLMRAAQMIRESKRSAKSRILHGLLVWDSAKKGTFVNSEKVKRRSLFRKFGRRQAIRVIKNGRRIAKEGTL